MGLIAIFAGPSLPAVKRSDDHRLRWYAPAMTGDILAAAQLGQFQRICLIDGYFDDRPSPWHKELLTVMEAGVEVFGSSSMGALRAAELDRLGMVGVGRIYRAYRQGLLTGDDEVALIHAPQSLDWAPLSVPQVEIRATLVDLVSRRRLPVGAARTFLSVTADIHYVDRDWPEIHRSCSKAGLGGGVVDLVQRAHIPLKMWDAIDGVEAALSRPCAAPTVGKVPQTSFLRALKAQVAARPTATQTM